MVSIKGTLKWRPASLVVSMISENRTVQAYSFSRTVNMELPRPMITSNTITMAIIAFFILVVTSLVGVYRRCLDEAFQRQHHIHIAVSAGGIDPRILPGAEVTVHGKCELYGIIGAKPPHLLSEDDRKAAIKMKDLAIDVGYRNPSELVSVGDFVTFRPNFSNLAGDYVSSKALDNRAGVMAVLMAMNELSDCPHTVQVMLSTGEERGCVGASGGMFDISPDMAIVVDVTFGISPGCDEDCCFELGSGGAVCTGPNICKALFDKIVKTAEENNIPYQIEVEGGDAGTNAGVIQLSNEGVATAMISIPIRYMHTPVEVVKRSDIENVSRLIAEVCKNA